MTKPCVKCKKPVGNAERVSRDENLWLHPLCVLNPVPQTITTTPQEWEGHISLPGVPQQAPLP